MSPMAVRKEATAATHSPAICAGVIRGVSSAGTGIGAEVADVIDVLDVLDVLEVAGGVNEMESTKADCRDEGVCVRNVAADVKIVVALTAGFEDKFVVVDDVVLAGDVLLTTTVKAVLVGSTALFWPKQTLYADASLCPFLVQDSYTQLRASSPSDSPV